MKTILKVIFCICFCHHLQAQNFFIEPKYPELLEPDATLLSSGHNYTLERVNHHKYIFKTYWDDIPDIATYKTFDFQDFQTLHGTYAVYNENGSINTKGEYDLGKRNGPWQENDNVKGEYIKGNKTGKWFTFNDENRILKTENYTDGKLDGEVMEYDSVGNVLNRLVYDYGELAEGVPLDPAQYIRPTFPGCDRSGMDDSSYLKCSDNKLLEFFKDVRYPSRARNEGIQGKVLIRFTVDIDGKIHDIMPLLPSPEILIDDTIKLFKKMPDWNPAIKNGILVREKLTIPRNYILEGD